MVIITYTVNSNLDFISHCDLQRIKHLSQCFIPSINVYNFLKGEGRRFPTDVAGGEAEEADCKPGLHHLASVWTRTIRSHLRPSVTPGSTIQESKTGLLSEGQLLQGQSQSPEQATECHLTQMWAWRTFPTPHPAHQPHPFSSSRSVSSHRTPWNF